MSIPASIGGAVIPIVGTFLAIIGIAGVVALASPRLFAVLVGQSNRWIDTARLFAKLERSIDVDAKVLPHSRLLGATTIAAVVFLLFFLYGR